MLVRSRKAAKCKLLTRKTLYPVKGGNSQIVKKRVKVKSWRVRMRARVEKRIGLIVGRRVEHRW